MKPHVEPPDGPPTVALLPWGDLIEDFLDGIGVSLEAFCTEMAGGWLFGYAEALRRAGVRVVLVCVSARVTAATAFTHGPTGATVWVLPAPPRYLRLRRVLPNPYAWTLEEALGRPAGHGRVVYGALRDVASYLAVPVRALARTLRRERCTALLCQEYESPRFDVCVALGRRLGLPVFATFQGGDWHTSRLEPILRPRSLRVSAGLVIATDTEAERVRMRYGVPGEKIARLFNPLDTDEWVMPPRDEARAALGLPEAARVAAWHGRIDIHRKGLDVLLDSWARVVEKAGSEDWHLLLVGSGRDAEAFRERLEAARLPRVRWMDQYLLDRSALRRYLAAADVYVFPSRHEGFPVALVEAMACGLPAAAAAAPGVADIMGEGEPVGITVPPGNSTALAVALERLLRDPLLGQAMGAAARHRARHAFSLEAVGQGLRAFLLRDAAPPRA